LSSEHASLYLETRAARRSATEPSSPPGIGINVRTR
jgi:hypothetical protein